MTKYETYSQREKINAPSDQPVDASGVVPEEQAGQEEQLAGPPARLSLIVWLLGFLFLTGILLYDLVKALLKPLWPG
jgi:hypothetical protein